MGYEEEAGFEKPSGKKPTKVKGISLQTAIEMGEYDPNFLATFSEWHNLSRHIQFQYIRQALENRHRHLITQWAEINNMLDFRLKPHLKDALKNIEDQLKKFERDREILFTEYSR